MNYRHYQNKIVKNKNILFIFAIFIICWYLSHYYLQGENMILYAHDNLDGGIAYLKVLKENGLMFSSRNEMVEPIMGGLPRYCFQSPFSFISLLFTIFKASTAYIVNEIIIHIVAFIGMFILLERYFLKNKKDYWLSIGVALIFSLLPFLNSGGLSVAGQPLLLFAFLNLRNNELTFRNWLIIFLFPFYSLLILSGIFIVFALCIIILIDFFNKGKINKVSILSVLLLMISYVISEYQLFLHIIDPLFESHRTEFAAKVWELKEILYNSRKMLLQGHYHSYPLHFLYILPLVLLLILSEIFFLNKNNTLNNYIALILIILFLITIFSKKYHDIQVDHILLNKFSVLIPIFLFLAFLIYFFRKDTLKAILLLSILAISYFYGLWRSEYLNLLQEKVVILKQIQFDRFYYLLPMIWFVLIVLILNNFSPNKNLRNAFLFMFFVAQIHYSFKMINGEKWMNPQSFKDYYAVSFFNEIKEYIGENQSEYKIINIGINPAKAIYNGFYTLDGYCSNYPLSYKHEFRLIIEKELDKNEKLKKYFDSWGNRCYLFYGELNREKWVLDNLDINVEQLKKMKCKYIFSKYRIENYNQLNIKLLKVFKNPYQKWNLKLYVIE